MRVCWWKVRYSTPVGKVGFAAASANFHALIFVFGQRPAFS
jgi:hypothetical protein